MKKVLILGGGFSGIYAALELDKRLGALKDVDITLVNEENFFLFTPMLPEVVGGDVHLSHIVSPIRQLLRRTRFLQGEVASIDLERQRVSVAHCSGAELDELEYDYLLLTLGSTTNFFGLPGVQERAITMKSLKDAIYLRNAIVASLEEAEFDATTCGQEPLLTYVVAGAGFAGIETIAAMNDFIRSSLKYYPNLSEDMVRIICVDLNPSVLPELGGDLGKYTNKKLLERGVELKLNTKIVGMGQRGVEFSDGTAIKPVIFVWTAGVSSAPIVHTLPCKRERGRVVVNRFMEIPGYDNVWAAGDCAWLTDPETGMPYPPTAQHASRQGVIVGRNMVSAIAGGGKREEFSYKSVGSLAAIGKRSGVAKVMGLKFSGFLAWVMWRAVYLSKLPRFEKKVRVGLDWFLDLFFTTDFVQFMTLATPLTQNEDVSTIMPIEGAQDGYLRSESEHQRMEAEAEKEYE